MAKHRDGEFRSFKLYGLDKEDLIQVLKKAVEPNPNLREAVSRNITAESYVFQERLTKDELLDLTTITARVLIEPPGEESAAIHLAMNLAHILLGEIYRLRRDLELVRDDPRVDLEAVDRATRQMIRGENVGKDR